MRHQIFCSQKIARYQDLGFFSKFLLAFKRTHYWLDAAHTKQAPTYVIRFKILRRKAVILGTL